MQHATVTVKNLPGYHVAYLRNIGPYGPGSGIPELWRRMERWATARDLWTPDRLCLGIAHDDPMVTDAAKCRYDAAIVIPSGFAADGGVNVADSFVLQDVKGLTRIAHDLNKDRIVATVVNQADQREIQVELDINVTLQNYGALQAVAIRNRILNSLDSILSD